MENADAWRAVLVLGPRTVVPLLAAAIFGFGSPALRAAEPPATSTVVKDL